MAMVKAHVRLRTSRVLLRLLQGRLLAPGFMHFCSGHSPEKVLRIKSDLKGIFLLF